ncbi:MAG TPA: aminotransferase class I/II-fold pyridoxal phosphate-dependent enzyme [Nitrososphaera sp.]|nr:aminotransferase class I/II-fold pyridoxal phosphate-dependent enzyme [Nitrososphaera sp.]
MERDQEINVLREQVRSVTADIIRDVQKRMELARQIGEIKSRKGIEVKDEKVEQEIRNMVLSVSSQAGMKPDFALRLLNILLEESESVQAESRQKPQRQTHLGIFTKAKQMEADGKEMIHLEVGEPDFPAPSAVATSLSESFKLKRYHYTETRGIPKLREAIAKRDRVTEDRIIVTPGGRFAVFGAIVSLLKPGNELVVIEPAWPAYKECADFVGARTRVLKASLEDTWVPDLKRLEELISPATKMIVLNYPNNPTGKILESKTIDKIISIAKDNHLYVLSDEVYADYAFEMRFPGLLEFGYDKTIMVSSFSKRYAMTGFRVGYGIAKPEIIKQMNKVQAVGITSVAEPIQYAALAAMDQGHGDNVKIMKERIDFVCSRLKDMALPFAKPDGALYVFPRIARHEDLELVDRLLEKGVALAPGSGFGDSYTNHVRISACQPVETLGKGLEKIASVIRERS